MNARLAVRVQPRARERGLVAWMADGSLKLRVCEPPEAGAANEAVTELLAEALGVRASAVRLTGGQASRAKRFEIEGLDEATVRSRITRAMDRSERESGRHGE